VLLYFKVGLLALVLNSTLGNRYLQSDLPVLHISGEVSDDLILPMGITVIFGGGSVDYRLKATRMSEWIPCEDGRFEVRSH